MTATLGHLGARYRAVEGVGATLQPSGAAEAPWPPFPLCWYVATQQVKRGVLTERYTSPIPTRRELDQSVGAMRANMARVARHDGPRVVGVWRVRAKEGVG